MKTQSLLSIVLVSSLSLFSACTPRDVNLSADGDLRTNGGKGGNNKNGGQAGFNLKSSFSLAAFLGERQIEVIQIVKIASETLDASNNKFSIEKKDRKDDGSSVVVLNTNFKDFKYEGSEGTVKSGVSRKLEVSLNVVDGLGLEKLSASAAQNCENKGQVAPCIMRANADSTDKQKYYVNLQETAYNIDVRVGDSADQLKIDFVADGQIIGSKGEKNTPQKVKTTINLVVDRASLATSTVKILSSKINFDYPNQNPNPKGTWFVKMDGSNQIVILDTACDRLNGSASFISDPKKPAQIIVFDDENISIQGKDWVRPLVECGTRPVVDLSRLQN